MSARYFGSDAYSSPATGVNPCTWNFAESGSRLHLDVAASVRHGSVPEWTFSLVSSSNDPLVDVAYRSASSRTGRRSVPVTAHGSSRDRSRSRSHPTSRFPSTGSPSTSSSARPESARVFRPTFSTRSSRVTQTARSCRVPRRQSAVPPERRCDGCEVQRFDRVRTRGEEEAASLTISREGSDRGTSR